MNSEIIAIVQARTASTRLPGKVLLNIAGEPMLARVVERASMAQTVAEVVVATTTDPADQAIVDLCEARGYRYFRGSPLDVLDRFYQAARAFGAQVIVRLTADCPLIDPRVIDTTVSAFLAGPPRGERGLGGRFRRTLVEDSRVDALPELPINNPQQGTTFDFAANRLPPPWKRTFPIGLDVEVCTFQALERAWKEADQPYQREHVMPYLYEQEGRFLVLVVDHAPDYGALRWTVDTAQDLELVRRVYEHFGGRINFSWKEVLGLFERQPDIAQINADVQHKTLHEVDDRR